MTPFEYAVIRVVPRVERGERVNVGVLLYCQARDYLCAKIHVDDARLRALDPEIDLVGVHTALEAWETTCNARQDSEQAGPVQLKPGERFRWLTAPRSTIIQPGPVHTGLTDDPAADLERLLRLLVL
ncbi:MAG: DUF3037 domain-containing protein [Micromonosporaceae bacterium]|nr:DUF3037 domain-containing protein [Micromonosporaceae bacterium]